MKDWKFEKGDYININTGEVVSFEESQNDIIVNNNEADRLFAKLYIDTLGKEFKPEEIKPAAQKLFWYLVKRMGYIKNGAIKFGPESKADIMEALEMKERTFRDAYYQLRDKKYIIFLAYNKIQINPSIIARGNRRDIIAIRQSIFKIDDKYIKITEIGRKKRIK